MKLYTFDGQTFKSLPDPFQNMSPMSDELFEQLGGTIYNAGSGYGSITIIGSNKLDTEVQAEATNSQCILISAGATLDLTQCEHHTSNVLYSPLSNGIRVGYWKRGTWTQEGTATVIPYGGGANVSISGTFQKLNRDGTTA